MSEDDMVIERGVEANSYAIGYFGYAYYQAKRDKVKLVAIDNGHGCVAPSTQTVADRTYRPLSRSLFIYVNTAQPPAWISRRLSAFIFPPKARRM
jgi:phosphate transport system substrate-binding protein